MTGPPWWSSSWSSRAMASALVVSYDGSAFHGVARQPGLRTVAGRIEEALSIIGQRPIQLAVAGRTDAGVHARAQVFSCAEEIDPTVAGRIGKLSGGGLAVRSIVPVEDGFHARFSARFRQYVYRIRLAVDDPGYAGRAWLAGPGIDAELLGAALSAATGQRDFSALCKARSAGGFQRHLLASEVVVSSGFVDVIVVGVSFCQQLVRRLVGNAVAVATGRLGLAEFEGALGAFDRARLATVAPAGGLYLWRVGYGDNWQWVFDSYRKAGFEAEWVGFQPDELGLGIECYPCVG